MLHAFRLVGKAKHVFEYIRILALTDEYEVDLDWWTLRLWLVRN